MFRNFKVLLIVLVVIVAAAGAYAFAAANTVEDSAAGYKASTVSGYAVTDLVYDLKSDDPTLVENITFSISPITGAVPAAIVKIQTAATGWKDCDLTAGTAPAMSVTCAYTTPFLALDSVVAMNIVASSTTDTP